MVFLQSRSLKIALIVVLGTLVGVFLNYSFTHKPPRGNLMTALLDIEVLQQPVLDSDHLKLTFKDVSGRDVRLSDFRGKYVLLNVWATWCTPCVAELPALQNLRKILGQGKNWIVLAVASEYKTDAKHIKDFTDKHRIGDVAGYYFDPQTSRIEKLLVSSKGLPTTYIVDSDGYVIAQISGAVKWDDPEIVAYLEQITKN